MKNIHPILTQEEDLAETTTIIRSDCGDTVLPDLPGIRPNGQLRHDAGEMAFP